MPNKNYKAGRRLEYEAMKWWEQMGFKALRTAGSHGEFDVIAYYDDSPAEFIQCKRVSTVAQATNLINKFQKSTTKSNTFRKILFVKVKGFKGPYISVV